MAEEVDASQSWPPEEVEGGSPAGSRRRVAEGEAEGEGHLRPGEAAGDWSLDVVVGGEVWGKIWLEEEDKRMHSLELVEEEEEAAEGVGFRQVGEGVAVGLHQAEEEEGGGFHQVGEGVAVVLRQEGEALG